MLAPVAFPFAAACGVDLTGTLVATSKDTNLPSGASGDGAPAGTSTATTAGADAADPGDAAVGITCTDSVLAFDGSGDFVTIPPDAALDLPNDFTVEAWIKPDSVTSEMHVISRHDVESSSGWLLRLANGRVEIVVYGSEFGDASYGAGGSGAAYVVAGKWAHVAGSLQGGTLRVYYDGALRDSQDLGLVFGRNSYAGPLVFGRSAAGEAYAFAGQLDDVRLSSKARYTSSTLAKPTTALADDTSTVALWAFDESSGGAVIDSAYHGHDGLLGSSPSTPTRVLAPCAANR
jgi:hypothetical protein